MRLTQPFAVIFGIAVALVFLIVSLNSDPNERLNEAFTVSDVGFVNVEGTAPSAAPLGDAESFSQWQQRLREKLIETFDFRDLDTAAASYIVHHSERIRGGLVREFLTFDSFDGTRIPAIRQKLEGNESGPGLLLLAGHTKPEQSGLAQLVYEYDSYQHAAATALARAGFTTLTFELRGFGLLGKPLNTEHRLVAFNALLEGSFYKKIVLTDAAYALAVLRGSEGVDAQRVGVAGASLGGELAVTLAALSEDISAVFFSSYGGSTGPIGFVSGQRENQPHYCHVIPGVKSLMRSEDVVLLLAPRAVLGTRGELDIPVSEEFRTVATAAWRASGTDHKFAFKIMPGGVHEFFVEAAIGFFRRNLVDTGSR